ncbi:hypothetical protein SCHPADRAFT_937232 [Schizopora paradoxa]|uniref:Uncharacterized protein n=1 Tax=Schizopora paradoxa TaxID=27342 RepID=A0A0H2S6A1_9AGAM|nr:hypothetical protein SCHPADRAFT_937232 [Schizopora paradoxa]
MSSPRDLLDAHALSEGEPRSVHGLNGSNLHHHCAGVDLLVPFRVLVVTVARPPFAEKRDRGVCHRGWRAAFMPRKGYSSRIAERSRGIGHKKAASNSWTNDWDLLHLRVFSGACHRGWFLAAIFSLPDTRSGGMLVARALPECE